MRALILKGVLAAAVAGISATAHADGDPDHAPARRVAAADPTVVGPYTDKYMSKGMPGRVTRTMPLSLALDELVPTDSKWAILLDDRLQTRDVQIYDSPGDWRERLRTMVEGNNLALLIDDRDRIITVASTREEATLMAQTHINQPKKPSEMVAMDTESGVGFGPAGVIGGEGEAAAENGEAAFETWPTKAKQMSRDELLNEEVGLHLRGVTLQQLLVKLFPTDWKVNLEIDREDAEAVVDFTFEGPRGRALEHIHKTFKIDVLPYPRLAVVVVKGGRS